MSSFVVSLLALALVSSAQSNAIAKLATPSTKNIVDLAASVPDLSTLVVALKAANLVATLSGPGPFTVFAPTNEAFNMLPPATLQQLLNPANIADLQAVLEYHVVSGAIFSSQLKTFQMVKTIQGGEVDVVNVGRGRVFVNNATVTSADNAASNGVVHIIDRVLIPWDPVPVPVGKTIVDVAAACPDLSTLVTALTAADLVDTLQGAGPFTVFAPSNEAFAKLPPLYLKLLLDPNNKATLVKLLTYHVVAAAAFVKDLTNGEQITTVEGGDVTVTVKKGFFRTLVKINDATVTTADVEASNGVVHIIDTVLMPPGMSSQNIVELAQATPSLSTLVTALVAADLVDTLEGEGPFTVFAPTNDAFNNLPAAALANLLKPQNKEQLMDLLTYHVVAGNVQAKDIVDGERLKTVEGGLLMATVNSTGVFINDAQVTTADVEATNGVVHIINQVLQPPKKNELYFNSINLFNNYPIGRCGDVNAAPRMPALLFDPKYKSFLKKYTKATIKYYGLAVGRCPDTPSRAYSPKVVNYTQFAGTGTAKWLPNAFVPLCRELCNCNPTSTWNPSFPTGAKICKDTPLNCACADVPDVPSKGQFCSLCGPKYNAPIQIKLWDVPGATTEMATSDTVVDLQTMKVMK